MRRDLKTTFAGLTGRLSRLPQWRHLVPGLGGQSLVSRLLGLVLLGFAILFFILGGILHLPVAIPALVGSLLLLAISLGMASPGFHSPDSRPRSISVLIWT